MEQNGIISNKIIMVLDISKSKIGILIKNLMSEKNDLPICTKCINTTNTYTLKRLIERHKPELIIIGLSTMKNLKLTENGMFIKNFVHKNRELLKPFEYFNEYNSTKNGRLYYNEYDENIASCFVIFNEWKLSL